MTTRISHDKPVLPASRGDCRRDPGGRYGDGDHLPSVRALPPGRPNPLTVAKAYQGFQDAGLIVVKRGVGLFVAPGARSKLRATERDNFLKAEWPAIRARMTQLGIDPALLMSGETA